jgi:hypothetical protein
MLSIPRIIPITNYSLLTILFISIGYSRSHSTPTATMTSRSRLYFVLALCLNTIIITFLILDSRSIDSFDMNLSFLPSASRESRAYDPPAQMPELVSTSTSNILAQTCGMCTANSTLCDELG